MQGRLFAKIQSTTICWIEFTNDTPQEERLTTYLNSDWLIKLSAETAQVHLKNNVYMNRCLY